MNLPKSGPKLNIQDELLQLREENARLKALLTQHGISWEEPTTSEPVFAPPESAPIPLHFTTDDKITLFRHLFRGREDVYPKRWESAVNAGVEARLFAAVNFDPMPSFGCLMIYAVLPMGAQKSMLSSNGNSV